MVSQIIIESDFGKLAYSANACRWISYEFRVAEYRPAPVWQLREVVQYDFIGLLPLKRGHFFEWSSAQVLPARR